MQKGFKAIWKLPLRAAPVLREFLFFIGWRSPDCSPNDFVVTQFAKVNGAYWGGVGKDGPGILIEGHLAEYGPNYLFRTGVAAKGIQEELGGEISVVVNGFSYRWQSAIKAYASFGITRWVFLGRKFALIGPVLFVLSCVLSAVRFLRMRNPKDILEIHLGGIKIGDLIYDEVLRSTKQPTIYDLGWDTYRVMAWSWFYYCQYHLLFFVGAYEYYIATHTAYPEYGLLCRVALQRGVKVIETTDIQMSYFDSIGKDNLPTYHQGINYEIRRDIAAGKITPEEREIRARESLRRRLDSEIKQTDAQKAYAGKVYTKADLYKTLGLSSGTKVGFVAAHVFRDSPHLSSRMLHADYYEWLVSSINCCANAQNIAWVIKPHPASDLYGEDGLVEELVSRSNANNIYICPSDLNTCSLSTCADVIVTVHGTIGLEYACLGIPIILAGTPFYAGFGFTNEPQTALDYEEVLCQAANLERLTQEQVSMALQVYEIWERQFDWNNPIVTSEVLANVWGSGMERDLIRSYQLLTKNLGANNPKNLKLWSFSSAVASGIRARG